MTSQLVRVAMPYAAAEKDRNDRDLPSVLRSPNGPPRTYADYIALNQFSAYVVRLVFDVMSDIDPTTKKNINIEAEPAQDGAPAHAGVAVNPLVIEYAKIILNYPRTYIEYGTSPGDALLHMARQFPRETVLALQIEIDPYLKKLARQEKDSSSASQKLETVDAAIAWLSPHLEHLKSFMVRTREIRNSWDLNLWSETKLEVPGKPNNSTTNLAFMRDMLSNIVAIRQKIAAESGDQYEIQVTQSWAINWQEYLSDSNSNSTSWPLAERLWTDSKTLKYYFVKPFLLDKLVREAIEANPRAALDFYFSASSEIQSAGLEQMVGLLLEPYLSYDKPVLTEGNPWTGLHSRDYVDQLEKIAMTTSDPRLAEAALNISYLYHLSQGPSDERSGETDVKDSIEGIRPLLTQFAKRVVKRKNL